MDGCVGCVEFDDVGVYYDYIGCVDRIGYWNIFCIYIVSFLIMSMVVRIISMIVVMVL